MRLCAKQTYLTLNLQKPPPCWPRAYKPQGRCQRPPYSPSSDFILKPSKNYHRLQLHQPNAPFYFFVKQQGLFLAVEVRWGVGGGDWSFQDRANRVQVLGCSLYTGSPADPDQLVNGLFVWKFKEVLLTQVPIYMAGLIWVGGLPPCWPPGGCLEDLDRVWVLLPVRSCSSIIA